MNNPTPPVINPSHIMTTHVSHHGAEKEFKAFLRRHSGDKMSVMHAGDRVIVHLEMVYDPSAEQVTFVTGHYPNPTP